MTGTRRSAAKAASTVSPNDVAEESRTASLRQIGERLRDLRQQRNLTMSQAARAADISPSFLGMLERGTSTVSISRLLALASVYEVNIADLLANVGEPKIEFVRSHEGLVVPADSDDVTIIYLSSPSWSMQPFLVRLEPGAHLESLSHAAEEFLHCISGSPTIIVDRTQEFAMSPGDTLSLPPSVMHTYINDTRGVAVLLGAVRHSSVGGPHRLPAAHGG